MTPWIGAGMIAPAPTRTGQGEFEVTVVRVDTETGVEERLEYVPTRRGRLYTWTALPPHARSCVVICSSIFGDFTANYHRERLLGYELTSRGFGVIRFHYTGEGNSEGDRSAMTFSSLCDDTGAILDHAGSKGFTDLAVVGTRVAAVVAAASVASIAASPLVLWEPVVQPLRFIAEANRAKLMSDLAQASGGSRASWREEMAQKGVLDLLGYDVYPALVDSFTGLDLVTVLGQGPRPVFIAGFQGTSTSTARLAATLNERGFEVTTQVYELKESWWFQSEQAPEVGALVSDTATWLDGFMRQHDGR